MCPVRLELLKSALAVKMESGHQPNMFPSWRLSAWMKTITLTCSREFCRSVEFRRTFFLSLHINKLGTFVFRAKLHGSLCHSENVRDVNEMDGVVHRLKEESTQWGEKQKS